MATVKLSVSDAAQHLGIKDESVRKRLLRNTLTWDKDASGHVWVYLDTSDEGRDTYQDKHHDSTRGEPLNERLIEQYEARIESLEHQLSEANTRDREHRRLLAAALERLPELETTPAPRGSPENAAGNASEGTAPVSEEPTPRSTQSLWQRLRRAWRGE
jgi:hypothetical protein